MSTTYRRNGDTLQVPENADDRIRVSHAALFSLLGDTGEGDNAFLTVAYDEFMDVVRLAGFARDEIEVVATPTLTTNELKELPF